MTWPAAIDGKFSGRPWTSDAAYLTSRPGQRADFYGPPESFDSAQIAYEEQFNKDAVSVTELTDITLRSYTDLTRQITEPVLWTPGQFDKIWCGTTNDCFTDPEIANEPTFYQPGVLTLDVIANTGHATLLGYGGADYLATVQDWLDSIGIHGVP